MTDQQLQTAFQDCNLPEEDFNHTAHIRMGWIYVRSMPLTEAIASFSKDLKAYTVHLGATDKYHETITWFFLILINERSSDLPKGHSWTDFKTANPDLGDSGGPLLKKYYSAEILSSERARFTPLLPDLIRP